DTTRATSSGTSRLWSISRCVARISRIDLPNTSIHSVCRRQLASVDVVRRHRYSYDSLEDSRGVDGVDLACAFDDEESADYFVSPVSDPSFDVLFSVPGADPLSDFVAAG